MVLGVPIPHALSASRLPGDRAPYNSAESRLTFAIATFSIAARADRPNLQIDTSGKPYTSSNSYTSSIPSTANSPKSEAPSPEFSASGSPNHSPNHSPLQSPLTPESSLPRYLDGPLTMSPVESPQTSAPPPSTEIGSQPPVPPPSTEHGSRPPTPGSQEE